MALQKKEIERLRWEFTRRSAVFKEFFDQGVSEWTLVYPLVKALEIATPFLRYIGDGNKYPLNIVLPAFVSLPAFHFDTFEKWWEHINQKEKVEQEYDRQNSYPGSFENFLELLF